MLIQINPGTSIYVIVATILMSLRYFIFKQDY